VHPAELERDGERDLVPHHPQRATGVPDRVAEDRAPEDPAHPRAEPARPAVAPVARAVALDHSGAGGIQTLEHRGKLSGVVLEIRVERGDPLAARGAKPGVEGGGLPVALPRWRVAHGQDP
jgi:hypothetical protein